MAKRKKKPNSETSPPPSEPGGGLPMEKMTFRVCEKPQSFDYVLDALADLLIDLAERDGTIKPVQTKPAAA